MDVLLPVNLSRPNMRTPRATLRCHWGFHFQRPCSNCQVRCLGKSWNWIRQSGNFDELHHLKPWWPKINPTNLTNSKQITGFYGFFQLKSRYCEATVVRYTFFMLENMGKKQSCWGCDFALFHVLNRCTFVCFRVFCPCLDTRYNAHVLPTPMACFLLLFCKPLTDSSFRTSTCSGVFCKPRG